MSAPTWTRDGNGPWTLACETVTDLVTFAADTAPADPGMTAKRRKSREYGDWSFFETSTFTQALTLAQTGWTDGRDEIERVRGSLVATILGQMPVREYVYATQGLTFDMGLVAQGAPECWLDVHETDDRTAGGNIVRVAMFGGAGGGVQTDVIRARGAAVAALCDLLETAGKRVELTVHWTTADRPTSPVLIHISALVKRPDEAMQIDALAFTLMHPSMLRRLIFSVRETLPDLAVLSELGIGIHHGDRYGCSVEVPVEADIMVPAAGGWKHEWTDVHKAKRWIADSLKSQGIALEDDPGAA